MTGESFIVLFLIVVIAVSIIAVIAVIGGLSSIFGAIANELNHKDEDDGNPNI